MRLPPAVLIGLVALNLALIFMLIAAPVGRRTVRASVVVKADRDRLWQAVWPLGSDAGWSGETVAAEAVGPDAARLTLSWEGREGRPIERVARFEDVVEGEQFAMRIVDDSALDPGFWSNYRETVQIAPLDADRTEVTISRTDTYRGLAFLLVRRFALRRELGKLRIWAETGRYKPGGLFEHPASQVGFAVLSAFILWPLFGFSIGGFVLAVTLTMVVALHELGHMAAFRLMGHRRVRMIFVPLLGGIAIGGRPYDSRFEVAFVALMGAGFSAFLVPVAIAASSIAAGEGLRLVAALFATLAGCAALFNLANLAPVWKFDGGQVLRQICPNAPTLAAASFGLSGVFLAIGHLAGFSPGQLVVAGAVFAALSLVTAGVSVQPRHDLKPIRPAERLAVVAGLFSVVVVHGSGLLWAADKVARYVG